MRIKSQTDFFSGTLFTAFGIAFACGATTYDLGTGERIGPGYFPLLVGVLIGMMGIVMTLRSLIVETTDREPIGKIAWKPLLLVLTANVLFGVLLGGLPSIHLPSMGFITAIYVLVFVASLADDDFSFKSVFVLATILAVGSYLAFVVALKLQFQVWPSFHVG